MYLAEASATASCWDGHTGAAVTGGRAAWSSRSSSPASLATSAGLDGFEPARRDYTVMSRAGRRPSSLAVGTPRRLPAARRPATAPAYSSCFA
jgi:hypothetical protein